MFNKNNISMMFEQVLFDDFESMLLSSLEKRENSLNQFHEKDSKGKISAKQN